MFLRLIKLSAMETYGKFNVQLHSLIILAACGVECSGKRFGLFAPGDSALFTYGYETGWAPEPAWTVLRRQKSVPAGTLSQIPLSFKLFPLTRHQEC
jgi:hypothetical protein